MGRSPAILLVLLVLASPAVASPPPPPEGWTATHADDNSAAWRADDFSASLDWVRMPYSPHGPLAPLLEPLEASARAAGDRIVSEGETEFAGFEGVELVRERGEGAARERVQHLFLRDGAYLVTITFECLVETCAERQEAFDLLLMALERP